MARNDPNEEWLGYVQPVGLVVAPSVLARYGLVPAIQTRSDTEEAKAFVSPKPDVDAKQGFDSRALKDPWAFFQGVLGWRPAQVAGLPGGPALSENLTLMLEESDTEIAPHWAVSDGTGDWQMLVRIEASGVQPDERGALTGWEATPHQRFERLLREKGKPIGILLTDDELRLVYAPRGETSGWLKFPLRSVTEVGGRPMLAGLKLLLNSFRLHNGDPEQRLAGLLKASREAQAEVSAQLATQVLGALHELLRGLHAADRPRIETLAGRDPEHLYDGLLTVLMRLVFLLYAEDRDLIPSRIDGEARAFYAQGYGVRSLYSRLLDDQAHHPDTMDERRGAWGRLLALFALVHHGDSAGDWIRGRGGRLFDQEAFPFLQGQDKPDDPPAPAPVTDGCILRILDRLISVKGEKLSYRTLDVEQIGSVYETVMGFTIETRSGNAVAIRAGKNDRTPVFVDVRELASTKPAERAKFLKERAGRKALPDKLAKPLSAAKSVEEVAAALGGIVDERGSPGGQLSPPGTPLLQPTDERRRTGSHYTPRSLTEPIVRHALEPAFERLGPDAKPEDVLALKVCDPAMGSGAFLVEACRALGDRLVKAWERWKDTRPKIPADETVALHACRLIAQRCLYGVDKNPRAVELAKLSLWLATLARDHEFTFLDHALKCGDSLVGLTTGQIAAVNWDELKPGLPLFRQLVKDGVAEAMRARSEIQGASDDTARAIQEERHRSLEERLNPVRIMGDAVISAFFTADKPKAREKARAEIESLLTGGSLSTDWGKLEAAAARLREGAHPISPFHWQVEFPEVFSRGNGGFDAIVGNPPFAGKNTIISSNRTYYLPWLQNLHQGAHGNADIVAHFFRHFYDCLREGGVFGLIATKTIGQGDTRASGIAPILLAGGAILRTRRRLKWPGEAGVTVSLVHIRKGPVQSPILDAKQVSRISAFLVEGELDISPAPLAANSGMVFQGSIILGMGFTFDDSLYEKGGSDSVKSMHDLITKDTKNLTRIFPYIGGDEINNDPRHEHHRFVIDFADYPLRRESSAKAWAIMNPTEREEALRNGIVPNDYRLPVAADWPDLLEIVQRRVKPERLKQKDRVGQQIWWRFLRRRDRLYEIIAPLRYVFCILFTAPHLAVARISAKSVLANTLNIFTFESSATFSAIQSRVHEVWARFFSSTLEDRLRYTPSDCFRTFPLPFGVKDNSALEIAGEAYLTFRADLMISRNEGLTKTYNRFHARAENAPDIVRLRELHAEMDAIVLRAYGWDDLADRAAPEFIEQDADEGKTPKTRLDWPAEFKDEVLARLLALNAKRAAAERAAGVMAPVEADDEALEEDDA